MRRRRSPNVGFRTAAVVAVLLPLCVGPVSARSLSDGSRWQPVPIGGSISVPGIPFPVPQGAVQDAIPIYQSILEGIRTFGGEGPAYARGLGFLAGLYGGTGNYSKAEDLYAQAQTILERNKASGRDLGWVLNNRGMTRLNAERYAEAAQSFRAAVAVIGEKGGVESEPQAIVWQNLASAYQFLGDAEASEEAYLLALDLLRGTGEDSSAYQATVNNLAVLYGSIGDFERARRQLDALIARGGVWNPNLRLALLMNSGEALRGVKDLEGAERRLGEALKFAGNGPSRVLILLSLSATHTDSGDLDKARAEAEEARGLLLKSDRTDRRLLGGVEATLGNLDLLQGNLASAEARWVRSKSDFASGTRRDRWLLSDLNRGLALVAQRRGQPARALELSRLALDQEIEELERILAFGSESQRLAYQSNAYLYDYLAEIGDAPLLAEAVLRLKGVVLDSLLAERSIARRAVKVEDRERLDRIHALKIRVMESLARGGLESTAKDEEIARALKREETALARSVSLPLRGERPPFDLAKIQAALASDEVLVEMMRYRLSVKGGTLEPHYGAVLIPHSGRPCWIPLARAEEMDALAEKVVGAMDGGDRGAKPDLPEGGASDAKDALRKLFDRLWTPLAAEFPTGTKRVLLSPDGALHFVPWAALIDDRDVFVAESWQISQVTSGRDLLRSSPVPEGKTVLALADGLGNLPYAREEAETLAKTAESNDWKVKVLTGDQASEPALFKEPGPTILHLATHGGQLRADLKSAIQTRLSRQPMYRAYVLLGGARQSLEAWSRGVVPAASSDGILNAEEVSGLDLSHTWLTVLSACQTGSGESRGGEGVLGLRRGFALAGTRNLLFTLWSVDDAATAQFMERFYERLFAAKDPFLAFHETQVARLRQLRDLHEDIRWAVAQAGGFVLAR